MIPLPAEVRMLLRRAGRRIALARSAEWIIRTVFVCAVAASGLALLETAVDIGVSPLTVLAAGTAGALVAGIIVALIPPRDLGAIAGITDVRLMLRERMSAAVDLARGRVAPTGLTHRVMEDAARAASGVEVEQSFRILAPRGTKEALVACVIAVIAAVLLPGLTLPGTPARDTVSRIRQEGRRLEQLARRLDDRGRVERAPEARGAAPRIRDAARALQREKIQRSEALARLEALGRELEAARRRVGDRLQQQAPPEPPAGDRQDLFRPMQQLDRQIKQMRELAARLAQQPETESSRRDMVQRLNELSQTGEGNMPSEARRKLDEARKQAGAGNTAAAGQALAEALQELEGLRAMMADDQTLAQAEQQVRRSAERIAQAPAGAMKDSEDQGQEGSEGTPRAPGDKRVSGSKEQGAEEAPVGPHEGSQPGQGRLQEKLGGPMPRLSGSKERSRVRGQEDSGPVQVSEMLGPGRRGLARTGSVAVPPSVVRRADEHMARTRIPAQWRSVVRRYFEVLAGTK